MGGGETIFFKIQISHAGMHCTGCLLVGWLDILFYITDQTATCAQSYNGDGLKII